MSEPRLIRYSEPYSPSGNLAADGFRKLLGTPNIDLLPTVVREAIQNSTDAAKLGRGPDIHLRLRRLDPQQKAAMLERTLTDLAPLADGEPKSAFGRLAEADAPWVLEICDFGTIGLAGPTRADRIPEGETRTDFIDFLRNVGSRRDTHQGGGTYGYGKTSLYLSSECATLVVDTQTMAGGEPIRRLMGCHLGSAFERRRDDGDIQRFTGRHWWGVSEAGENFVDPLEGEAAATLADTLGFLPRDPASSGTSLMIVMPRFVDGDGSVAAGMLAESILWYFWPRMLDDVPEDRRMRVSIELDGRAFAIPRPEDFPPLDLYAEALKEIRRDPGACETIRSHRPARDLGKLKIASGMRGRRRKLVPDEFSIIPAHSAHIAVMRPVELVVRYYDGEPFSSDVLEWGGAFVTTADAEVEEAFAAAEPPAHDDWQPAILPPGNGKTFVNVAIRRVREAAAGFANPALVHAKGAGEGAPLAQVSAAIGQMLAAPTRSTQKRRRSRKSTPRRAARLAQPTFAGLQVRGDQPVARFTIAVPGADEGTRRRIRLRPEFVVEGGSLDPDATMPIAILEILNGDGNNVPLASEVTVSHTETDLEVFLTVVSGRAVTLQAQLIEEE
ncbi:hypothetical protein [uncultured Maricaulis sp.]|uniref:hypothetical protein n=1 Tax=uncultured Maricaulis sp. TaxID=174710 RepID=UPI0026267C80|nr:hypothetical protein [uncultured Maricaulis sp.]